MNIRDLISPARWHKGTWWGVPVTAVEGCTRISPACDHCWAEAGANMHQHNPNAKVAARQEGLLTGGKYNGKIRLMYDDILKPLHRRKPTVYTWWNDLFHPDVPYEFIDQCFAVMAYSPQHVHIVCTKRAERRCRYLAAWDDRHGHALWDPRKVAPGVRGLSAKSTQCPLDNVIQMTTCENQAMADERIPWLLKTPAAVRAVAIEPCLGPVDLRLFDSMIIDGREPGSGGAGYGLPGGKRPNKIGWVICGSESGPGARPMHPQWARSVRDQCEAAGVPFLHKGWGEWAPHTLHSHNPWPYGKGRFAEWMEPTRCCPRPMTGWSYGTIRGGGTILARVGKARAGRLLDGKLHDGYPEVAGECVRDAGRKTEK